MPRVDPLLPTRLGGPAHSSGEPYPEPDTPEPEVLRSPDTVPLAVPSGYQSFSTLVLDGRDVRFITVTGIVYTAPAIVSSIITEQHAAIENKSWGVNPDGTQGYWPDDAYISAGWQEI